MQPYFEHQSKAQCMSVRRVMRKNMSSLFVQSSGRQQDPRSSTQSQYPLIELTIRLARTLTGRL